MPFLNYSLWVQYHFSILHCVYTNNSQFFIVYSTSFSNSSLFIQNHFSIIHFVLYNSCNIWYSAQCHFSIIHCGYNIISQFFIVYTLTILNSSLCIQHHFRILHFLSKIISQLFILYYITAAIFDIPLNAISQLFIVGTISFLNSSLCIH